MFNGSAISQSCFMNAWNAGYVPPQRTRWSIQKLSIMKSGNRRK